MAAGISPAEIAEIFNRAIKDQMGEKEVADLVAGMMAKRGCTKEEIEKMLQLQRSLNGGVLAGGDKHGTGLGDLFASGMVDADLLQKALVMQKVLAACGLSPEDLGKAFLLQNAMIEAGASPENVANCMHRTLLESGISLEHMITLMEIELKASLAKGLTPSDIVKVLQFDKILGASSFAKRVMRRINPEALRLMEATVKKQVPGQKSSIMEAMKSALGGVIDTATLQAMEVSEAMAKAGASKEEIEEMMQMIINKGGGISEEFLDSIKQAMAEVWFHMLTCWFGLLTFCPGGCQPHGQVGSPEECNGGGNELSNKCTEKHLYQQDPNNGGDCHNLQVIIEYLKNNCQLTTRNISENLSLQSVSREAWSRRCSTNRCQACPG